MSRKAKIIALSLLLLPQLSLATNSIPPQDSESLYLSAERSFLRDDLEGSLRELNTLFSKPPTNQAPKTLALAYNLRGLVFFQMKNLGQALSEFERAVEVSEANFSSTDSSLHLARYNLANTLFQLGQDERANKVLLAIEPRALDNDTRIRYNNLLGNTLLKLEKNTPAMIAFLITSNDLQAQDSVATEALVRKAYSISKKLFAHNAIDDLEKLDAFESRMPSNGIGTWTLRLVMARGYSVLGRRARAQDLVDSFVSNAENHPLQPEAAEMKALFNKLSIIEPNKIGVLLPLSGNFSKYGQLSLNSIMMALSALEDMPVNADAKKNKVTLVLRDSGESVESALKGFDQLVADDHVVGVIGPLLSRQAVAVAQKAQEYGVPIFSISQKQGLEQVGNYVFPIALTPSQQIQAMINFTMKERGFKRFAILAPESPAGEEYVRLFWDLVEQNGGDITGIERYTPGSTDFRDEIKRLVGLEYLDSRKLELEDLKRREDNYASKLKVRGVLRKRLLAAFRPKPIIDFDAIFVPDGPQAIGQIAPSFAVQDVKNIPFLGINTWNTPEIIRRAGQYLQNSYFVDIFYPNSRGKLAAEFIADYSRFFGSTPGTLEVQAYDASRILMSAIESGSVGSRADLVNYILTKKNYSGISGKFNFTSGGLERSAYLLGVKGTEILEIMPPILVR